MKEENKEKLISAIIIFLALTSANIVNASSENISNNAPIENFEANITNTTDIEGLGWPDLRITAKSISPSKVRPGNTAMLGLTISEVRGDDWAKDVTAIVEILNPDGTSFSETGTNRATHYLGNIGRYGSTSTSFKINVPQNVRLGPRSIKITVIWFETGWLDLGTYGPYYTESFIDFTVAGIKVTSPNGGEDWQLGTKNSITWNNYIEGPYVKIELLKGGVLNSVISSSIINDGSLDWTISPTQPSGNDYKIRITSISDPTFNDTSDNNFIISSNSPSITVTYPNGGENFVRGTTKTLRWSYSSSPGPYVKIDLLKAGILNRVIAYSTPIGSSGSGYYSWAISSTQTLGNDYKVRVTSTSNPAYKDTSNNNFTIRNPYITVASPNGGESWKRGTTHTISWRKDGNVGSYVKIQLYKSGILKSTTNSYTPNDGYYSWTVPSTQTLGSDYKIKITTSNSLYNDFSNNNFRIY